MTKWVYSFGPEKTEGRGAMKNLLGGKGANLAEMAYLGLPVPPGFTISTELCTYFYANGRTYPADLAAQVDEALIAVNRQTGHVFGDAANPLLVSVRSGARASMPGMMDTVLNLGLNDESVKTLAKTSGDERFAYDSYRRFIQMYSNVVLELDHNAFEEILEGAEGQEGLPPRHRPLGRRLARDHRRLQGRRAEGDRQAVPAGSARPVVGRDRRRVRLVDERARHHLPPAQRHSRRLGHRGQRPGDGVRQHGRDERHRRRLHPQPVDRREQALRRVPGQRAGRRRRRRHSHAAEHHRGRPQGRRLRQAVARDGDAGGVQAVRRNDEACSRSTTATCRTWSSPSSAASCGCCRPATASARRAPRCASRSRWPTRAC